MVVSATAGLKTGATTAESSSIHASLAVAAVWHISDHYGQLVEYLRMNRMKPPSRESKKSYSSVAILLLRPAMDFSILVAR